MKPVMKLMTALVTMLCVARASAQSKKIIAYYPEWAAHYNTYYVKDIEKCGAADKLTVLIYAFSEPGPDSSGTIVPKFMNDFEAYQRVYTPALSIDGVADDSTQQLRGQFNQLRKLKALYPNLKVLISIGGWDGCKYFSDAVATPKSRERFTDAIIKMFILGNLPIVNGAGGKGVAKGIFDGVDIDWEYPMGGGLAENHYNPNDRNNLTAFFALLRKKFDSVSLKLIITAAVPSSEKNASHYNIRFDQQYLDWYNLMTYDYVGEWVSATNHHTNLLTSPRDTSEAQLSFDKSIHLFVDSFNVSSRKIVPGAAFYGQGWDNVDSTNDGLYQHGKGIDLSDSVASSRTYSFWSSLLSEGFDYHWDTLAMAPWLYSKKDHVFWTFDDAKSIALKSRYVDAYDLGGIMCWDISGDDSCGTLINAMYSGEMPDVNIRNTHCDKIFPSIELRLMSDRDRFTEGDNIILNTEIEDQNPSIAKVEFFVDNKSIGYDTEVPFDWVWFNTHRGKHKIKAVATDTDGNRKTLNVVDVMVRAAQGTDRSTRAKNR